MSYTVLFDDFSQQHERTETSRERAIGLAKQIAGYRHADGSPQYASVTVWNDETGAAIFNCDNI